MKLSDVPSELVNLGARAIAPDAFIPLGRNPWFGQALEGHVRKARSRERQEAQRDARRDARRVLAAVLPKLKEGTR